MTTRPRAAALVIACGAVLVPCLAVQSFGRVRGGFSGMSAMWPRGAAEPVRFGGLYWAVRT